MNEKAKTAKRVDGNAKVIGRNLMLLRNAHGISQRKIANILGTSFQQIQKYEKGQNRIPADKLYYLKIFFDVPYAVFFEGLSDNSGKHYIKNEARQIIANLQKINDEAMRQKITQAVLILTS